MHICIKIIKDIHRHRQQHLANARGTSREIVEHVLALATSHAPADDHHEVASPIVSVGVVEAVFELVEATDVPSFGFPRLPAPARVALAAEAENACGVGEPWVEPLTSLLNNWVGVVDVVESEGKPVKLHWTDVLLEVNDVVGPTE